jgi:hypothetical protein
MGETFEASWAERHVGETRHPNDLADVVEPEAEPVVRDPEHHQMLICRCAPGRRNGPYVLGHSVGL